MAINGTLMTSLFCHTLQEWLVFLVTYTINIVTVVSNSQGMGMYVLNTEFFGHMLKPKEYDSFEEATAEFINWKIETLG